MTIADQLEAKLKEHVAQHTNTNLTTTPTKPTTSIVSPPPTTLEDGILTFKHNMLDWANNQLKDNSSYLEIKEMKDLNSIVKDLEASTLKKDDTSTTTVNILVQNMLDRYKDDI